MPRLSKPKRRRAKGGSARPTSRSNARATGKHQRKHVTGTTCFPKLTEGGAIYGIGVLLAVASASGKAAAIATCRAEAWRSRPGEAPRQALLKPANDTATANLLNGLAHRARFNLAKAIFLGSHTHRLLSQASGLKTGPLYHHLRGLQQAGIIESKDRNSYGLTEIGTRLLLVAAALGSNIKRNTSAAWRERIIWLREKPATMPRRAPARR